MLRAVVPEVVATLFFCVSQIAQLRPMLRATLNRILFPTLLVMGCDDGVGGGG